MSLKIYAKDPECWPFKAHYTDAGLDLRAAEHVYIKTNQVAMVPTGIHVEIPEGNVGLVFPRSGLSSKVGLVLANGVGVIDSDYRGEIFCAMRFSPMKNVSAFKIEQYERIAQLVILPIDINYEQVDSLSDLSDTLRGTGGFGSTDNG